MAKVARLLEQMVPEHYRVALDIDLSAFTYSAHETVTFELVRPSRELTMHAWGLGVRVAEVDKEQSAVSITSDNETQTVKMVFAAEIAAGKHELVLEFMGEIQDSLHGFYRSSYQNGGKEKWLAATQFEPVSAREALVCIDEPAAKAVFELSLVVPEELQTISNTQVVSEASAGAGRKLVTFAPTPKMSAYLLAFLIGEFEYIEGKTPEGVLVRAYAVPGLSGQLEFALESGVKALSFYTAYFGIDYPLPKLDLIAVPDFATGAMENWGAVTFRDTALLLDPSKTALVHKQWAAEVVLHELAHQWFGDLVTMAWWNDLWLNEGFASWMEVMAMDKLHPEWQVWTQFCADHLARAMELDGLANTHPIEVAVDDPRALDEIFDAVSYSKGAAIINMLHRYVGDDAFRRGLHDYLEAHKYSNAATHDLWFALARAADKPVAEMMSVWTSQPGYPILTFDGGKVKQQRFFSSPREAKRAEGRTVWPVPFSVLFADGSETTVKLMQGAEETAPKELADADWFKPNPGQTGFYRVHYTQAMVQALGPALASGKLVPVDRFGVVNDVTATTEAGLTGSTTLLDLMSVLRNESDYVVWSGVSGGLGALLSVVEDEAVRDELDRFGRWLTQPNAARLGWESRPDDSSFDTLLRPLVLQQAVRFDDSEVTAAARQRFDAYMGDGDVDPNVRAVVLYAAARNGGEPEFDAMLERYRKEQSPQVRMSLLSALGRFRRPELIKRFLELGISSDVRPQDIFSVIAGGFRNREARDLTWQFMQDNWGLFMERYGDGGHMLERFPVYAGWGFATHEKAAEIGKFFAEHPHPVLVRPAAQAVEGVELKADWYDRDKTKIESWLRDWETKQK